jgi:glycosyltransferase involved in cell wall biosynthesis
MKIVYISTAFPRSREDRINPWLFETVKRLKEENCEIIVFTSSYKGIKQKNLDGIKIYRFRYLPKKIEILTHDVAVPERIKMGLKYKLMVLPYIIFGFLNSKWFSLKEKFDIIHVHWPFPHIIFGIVMKIIKRKPLICTFHGGEIVFLENLPNIFKKIFIYFLKFSDFFTVNSSFTKDKLLKISKGILKEKIQIIPFGTTVEDFFNGNFLKKEDKKIRILFAGRLIERKGVHILLRAFKKVVECFENVELIIAGDGPWRKKLEDLTFELGIKEKVIFKGHLNKNELEEEYKKADIFVLPSIHDEKGDTETLGVVLIEAMEFNVPVIATNVGGIPDIVKDGYNGILVPEKDINALSDAIIKLMKDKKLRENLSRNAKTYIKEKFSWDKIIKDLKEIYLNLAKNYEKKRAYNWV